MVIVKVSDGTIEGERIENQYGNPFFSFKGIPYAEPPVGNLRFKAPQPVKPWHGVRSAKKCGSICPQYDPFIRLPSAGSEDCLFINVYTPNMSPSTPLPVMVWIHGGGFVCGSGNDDIHGPEFLIRKNVVLVTFNYRLEVLGFLCLDTEDVPGNAGMKDQVAALKWVQNNIGNFGGDPNNVTIFGVSAGAASVSFHLISPMSKGLFRRAIMQSGSCTSWWALTLMAKERGIALARNLGCDSEDDKEILRFLQSQPVKYMTNVQVPLTLEEGFRKFIHMYFSVVSERQFDGVEPFFTGDVFEALRKGIHEGVEVINGVNADDGIVQFGGGFGINDVIAEANEYREYFVPKHIIWTKNFREILEVGERLKEFYFNNKKIRKNNIENLCKFLNVYMFEYGSILFQKILASQKSNKCYFYQFTCKSERNMLASMMKLPDVLKRPVTCHADELAYLFTIKLLRQNVDMNSPTFSMIDHVTELWTNFAKHGNPTPEERGGTIWKPYTLDDQHYLDIGKELVLKSHFHKDQIDFWEQIFEENNLKHLVGKQ